MSRSPLQPGPATDHYHATSGVDETPNEDGDLTGTEHDARDHTGVPGVGEGGGGLTNPLTENLDLDGNNIENVAEIAGETGEAISITSAVHMNDNAITELPDPTDPQDAATKAYADTVAEEVFSLFPVQRVTIDLTAGQIATLSSVPVEVVAAPGANKVIVPVAASFQFAPGAVAFDSAGSTLELFVGASVITAASLPIPWDSLAAAVIVTIPPGPLAAPTVEANEPLTLRASGDPDGAGDGVARVTVLYYVADLI